MKIPSSSDKKTWFSDLVCRGRNKPGNPHGYRIPAMMHRGRPIEQTLMI